MSTPGTRRPTGPRGGSSQDPRATPAPPAGGRGPDGSGAHMLQPIRWPKPERGLVKLALLWFVGVLVAVVPPALIVPPSSDSSDTGLVLGAFAFTVAGVAVMVGATVAMYRRSREVGILILAVVPTGVLLAGGLMLMATKLFL